MAYTKEEIEAIETVLDLGLWIENWNGDKLTRDFSEGFHISFHNGNEKDYETIEKALKKFIK